MRRNTLKGHVPEADNLPRKGLQNAFKSCRYDLLTAQCCKTVGIQLELTEQHNSTVLNERLKGCDTSPHTIHGMTPVHVFRDNFSHWNRNMIKSDRHVAT